MDAVSQIRQLVQDKLVGKHVDVVGCVDGLLSLASRVGELRCSLASENALRFEMGVGDSCEIELDACRAKLRMACARLSVLCNGTGAEISPYGGEGVINEMESARDGAAPRQWTVTFSNTPAKTEFAIIAGPPVHATSSVSRASAAKV